MVDENRSYPGGEGHPPELPVGTLLRGSIARAYTYKGLKRNPASGKFEKSPGTLRTTFMTGWSSETLLVRKSRYDFKIAMDEWKALPGAEQQTYKDRAKQVRRDHPNILNPKRWWLGHHLFISENLRRNKLTPPDYDSGWVAMAQGAATALTHNLGGDVDDYHIDMQGKGGDCGQNIQGIGGEGDVGVFDHGFCWCTLTTTQITIHRGATDPHATHSRVRIWVY